MREHDSLWLARGAGCVNDCGQIVSLAARQQLIERCRIFAVDLLALFFNAFQRQRAIDVRYSFWIEHNHLLEMVTFNEALARVLEHSTSRNQKCARARISQNKFDLIDRFGGVERNSNG